jgi:hypothetical protein
MLAATLPEVLAQRALRQHIEQLRAREELGHNSEICSEGAKGSLAPRAEGVSDSADNGARGRTITHADKGKHSPRIKKVSSPRLSVLSAISASSAEIADSLLARCRAALNRLA